LETFHLSNVFGGLQSPAILSVNSVDHPTLQAGVQYWLVVSTPNLLQTYFSWCLGPPGTTDEIQNDHYIECVQGLGEACSPTFFPQNNNPTLAIFGGTPSAASPPEIAAGGIVNAADSSGSFSQGSWVSIFGSNLASSSRGWQASDFTGNGLLPTSLDGVSVLVNGTAAAVSYISPGQINIQLPDENFYQFPFSLQVVTPAGASAPVPISADEQDPAFFTFTSGNEIYVVATFADGTLITPANPAHSGDTIVLYGTGFGPSNPPISSGTVVQIPEPLQNSPQDEISIAGILPQITYAGIVEAGLDQINLVVPPVPPGNQPLVLGYFGETIQTLSLPIAAP